MAEGYCDIGIKWKQLQVTTDEYGGFLLNLPNNNINKIVCITTTSDNFMQKYRLVYGNEYVTGYIVSWNDEKVVNTTVDFLIGYV